MKPIQKISFIGFGNMAKAFIQGLVPSNQYQIHASAPSLTPGITETGIITHFDNCHSVKDADLVILAVKPQQMEKVLADIKTVLPAKCIVISIAAGLPLAFFASRLSPGQSLIRCMPNIAVAYHKGAMPLIANHQTTPDQKIQVSALLDPLGITAWLENEADLDIYTAVSGSGPAYVFLFLEALAKAATNAGMDAHNAADFSLYTLAGAVRFLEQTGLDPAQARAKVTSKNGTTAAALDVLEKEGFETIIAQAVEAACKRARALGSKEK